jgi:hypothetical protein
LAIWCTLLKLQQVAISGCNGYILRVSPSQRGCKTELKQKSS